MWGATMPLAAMVGPGTTGNKHFCLNSLIKGLSAKPLPSVLKNSQGRKDAEGGSCGWGFRHRMLD